MFKLINIFKEEANVLKIYRCFQSLENNKYHVQSLDLFYKPIDIQSVNNSNLQLLELFFDNFCDEELQDEELQEERYEEFVSLQDAIQEWDKQFGN